MAAKKQTPTKPRVFKQVDPETAIHQTIQYEKFKRMPGNRKINEHHVLDLVDKIGKKDLKSPIVINKQWEVIDGQHCLEARRKLDLPVYYRFGEKMNLEDVQTLNSTSLPWSNDDFCDSYIELGNSHYRKYRAFRKKYGFPHEVAIILLTSRDLAANRKRFREGEFRIADLADAEKKAEMIHTLREFTSGFRQDVFVKAIMIALTRDGFNFPRFLEKAKENRAMFGYQPTIDANLIMIETIYNTGHGRKVPLRFELKRPYNKKEQSPEAEDPKEAMGNGRAGRNQTVSGREVAGV